MHSSVIKHMIVIISWYGIFKCINLHALNILFYFVKTTIQKQWIYIDENDKSQLYYSFIWKQQNWKKKSLSYRISIPDCYSRIHGKFYLKSHFRLIFFGKFYPFLQGKQCNFCLHGTPLRVRHWNSWMILIFNLTASFTLLIPANVGLAVKTFLLHLELNIQEGKGTEPSTYFSSWYHKNLIDGNLHLG